MYNGHLRLQDIGLWSTEVWRISVQETADSLAKQAMSIGNYSAFCGCLYDQGTGRRRLREGGGIRWRGAGADSG